jgi:hypothetical protein
MIGISLAFFASAKRDALATKRGRGHEKSHAPSSLEAGFDRSSVYGYSVVAAAVSSHYRVAWTKKVKDGMASGSNGSACRVPR